MSTINAAVASVDRIRYFRGDVLTRAKMHVTVGHSTVMATVHFFADPGGVIDEAAGEAGGSGEPGPAAPAGSTADNNSGTVATGEEEGEGEDTRTGLRAFSVLDEPSAFDWDADYVDLELLHPPPEHAGPGEAAVVAGCQYVYLEFEKPITCPPNSVIIGSKLDTDKGMVVHVCVFVSWLWCWRCVLCCRELC